MSEAPISVEEPVNLNQAAWRTIEHLTKKHQIKRTPPNSANATIEVDGEPFTIELITNPESPDLAQVQRLFEDVFGTEEVDSIEVLKSAIKGETQSGIKDETLYKIHVFKNQKEEVIAAVTGGVLDLRDENDQPTGKMIHMAAYGVGKAGKAKIGFASQGLISALIDAIQEAASQNKKLVFSIGECIGPAEFIMNRSNYKRMYKMIKTGSTEKITEVEYVQPALEFNPETGEVAKGAGEAPEHLMINFFGEAPAKKEITQAVRAIYRWNNLCSREDFKNEAAYLKHLQYIENIARDFNESISEEGKLIFLSAREREQKYNEGAIIHEYKAADGKLRESQEENF